MPECSPPLQAPRITLVCHAHHISAQRTLRVDTGVKALQTTQQQTHKVHQTHLAPPCSQFFQGLRIALTCCLLPTHRAPASTTRASGHPSTCHHTCSTYLAPQCSQFLQPLRVALTCRVPLTAPCRAHPHQRGWHPLSHLPTTLAAPTWRLSAANSSRRSALPSRAASSCSASTRPSSASSRPRSR